jgi:hypothetical protein
MINKPYIAPDVQAELDDAEHATHKHGRSAYKLGCRGPICRWVEVLRQRERNAERAERADRTYQPGLRRPRQDERAAELNAVIAWYEEWYDSLPAVMDRIKHRSGGNLSLKQLDRLIAKELAS